MALWHFINKDGSGASWSEAGTLVSEFDDGLCYQPGEDGFSREAADAKAEELDATAELTGVPGWHERIEREAREAAEAARIEQEREAEAEQKRQAHAIAEAEINALLNPPEPETAEDARRREINDRFDALLAAAPDRADDIAKLRVAELDAVK